VPGDEDETAEETPDEALDGTEEALDETEEARLLLSTEEALVAIFFAPRGIPQNAPTKQLIKFCIKPDVVCKK
jgi:hypothetical protein